MFTVNMTADIWWADQYDDLQPWSADFASLQLVNLLTNGKFITLFSVLFGIGFYVQSESRMAANASVISFWLRRLSGLLMIGLIANACTLPAWILVDYAVFGLGLLFVYRWSPRYILMAAVTCILAATFFGSIIPAYWPPLVPDVMPAPTLVDEIHESIGGIHGNGGFLDISALTMLHLLGEFTDWRYYPGDIDILGLMILGLYIGRRGAIFDREVRKKLAKSVAPWFLGIGLLGCGMWIAMDTFGLGDENSVHHSVASSVLAWPIGMPVLGLGYAAAVTLMMESDRSRIALIAFAPIGRMALTNYLFSGFVAAFISFRWGLGLYGQIYPAAGLLIVIALLPVQMFASRWWLDRFAYGPTEWLWRSWTYGRIPPMKR